jgi:hypothetical protein
MRVGAGGGAICVKNLGLSRSRHVDAPDDGGGGGQRLLDGLFQGPLKSSEGRALARTLCGHLPGFCAFTYKASFKGPRKAHTHGPLQEARVRALAGLLQGSL